MYGVLVLYFMKHYLEKVYFIYLYIIAPWTARSPAELLKNIRT